MGSLLLTKKGMQRLLTYLTQQASPAAARTIMLFKNNAAPTVTTVLSGLTPATFPGYAPQSIPPASYGAAAFVAGTWAQAPAPPVVWVATATPGTPETIYGYGVVENGTDLLWVNQFGSPPVISAAGQAVGVQHYDRIIGDGSGGVGSGLITTEEMDVDALKLALGQSPADTSYYLRLFTNTPSLTPAMVTADFTDPTFPGYTQQVLPGFVTPYDDSHPLSSDYAYNSLAPYNLFTPTGSPGSPETVRGYFVVGQSSGDVKWAQYFGTPITITTPADVVFIVAALRLSSFFLT